MTIISITATEQRDKYYWRYLNVNKRGVSVNNSAIVQQHLVNYMYCWSTCGVMVKCCCVNWPWQFYIYWYRFFLNTLQLSTDHRSMFQCNISQYTTVEIILKCPNFIDPWSCGRQTTTIDSYSSCVFKMNFFKNKSDQIGSCV